MIAVLVGAAVVESTIESADFYIGVDGGVNTLLHQGIEPNVIVGDFDSINSQDIIDKYDNIKLPMEKDDTDTAIAIEYLINNGYNDIRMYGVTGGRIDHFYAVMCLLRKYHNIKMTIIDKQNKIYILDQGTHYIKKDNYKYLSFFALNHTFLSISNCLYNLDNYELLAEDPLCVSNEIVDEMCLIETSDKIIVIQSKN